MIADFVVAPRTEAEVIEVLRVCHAQDVPVTTRGAGTGNYGQSMPLAGGVILHTKHLTAVKAIHPGRVIVEPGCLLKDLDAACKAHSGQELRMFSSTWATATIGGFIAGGSGGVGSCTWGALRDLGNIIRLRVVTMEAEPRILEFTGEELHRVSHAYGTNGIITEIEMPLAPAYDWIDLFVTCETFPEAAAFGMELANEDGILKKLVTVFEAPIAQGYFQRVAPQCDPGQRADRPDDRAPCDGRVPDLPRAPPRGPADLPVRRARLGRANRARSTNTAGTTPRCVRSRSIRRSPIFRSATARPIIWRGSRRCARPFRAR